MTDGPGGMRTGVRIGVDVGTVRIGVARCDPHGMLATPVRTVARSGPGRGVDELAQIVADYEAIEVVVGLPRSLSGQEGAAARSVRAYAGAIAKAVRPLPVRLVDERLTTVSAHQALHASGRAGRKHRQVVDQVAATMILQAALDQERHLGQPPGTAVGGEDSANESRPQEEER
nr:Holliday junction resolvase RuvX [Occultella glacieicola]